MRLKKVTLNNYRCFENLEIELHPRLTVLVGENGVGKTAILDGIAAALSPILKHLSSANQRLSAESAIIKDTDFRLEERKDKFGRKWGERSEYAQIVVETTQESLKWDYYASSREGVKPPDRVGETALADYLQKIWDSLKTAKPELFPVFAYYGVQRGYINEQKKIGVPIEARPHPVSALVNALDPLVNFEALLAWFYAEESDELRAIKELQDWLSEESPDFDGQTGHTNATLDAVRSVIEIMLGNEYSNPHFTRNRQFVLESVKTEFELQVSQLSQGYQSMLALGMDFARRLELATNHYRNKPAGDELNRGSKFDIESMFSKEKDPLITELEAQGWWSEKNNRFPFLSMLAPAIMLVDEIDLHLHPSWQQRVLDDLMRAFPGTQFIVTTHSPQVLSTVPMECIRILRDGVIETQDIQTRGVSSADVLASAMSVDPKPNVPESTWLSEYRALIQQGLQDNPEGLALRDKLIGHFGPRHPEVLDCERMIRWEAFKQKLPSRSANS